MQEARKDTINAIVRLARKHSIIASSEKEIERLKFDFEAVKLERLSAKKSIDLAKRLKLRDEIAEKIANKSSGLPLLIVRGAEYYKATGNVKTYLESTWKKDLLKKAVIVAYLCLSLRYLSSLSHNWELYSILSIVGYFILAFNRVSKKV